MRDIDTDNLVLVDLDGVLHPYSKGWLDGSLYDPPKKEAINFMKTLKNKGYHVGIYTSRLCIDEYTDRVYNDIKTWLETYTIPYDLITGNKIPAICYVDDRGIHFDGNNWNEIIDRIEVLSKYSCYDK